MLIREPRPDSLTARLKARIGDTGDDPPAEPPKEPGKELRDYGVGAQILLDLGVREMVLLSNTQKTVVGLEGYGLTIVEQRPISKPESR